MTVARVALLAASSLVQAHRASSRVDRVRSTRPAPDSPARVALAHQAHVLALALAPALAHRVPAALALVPEALVAHRRPAMPAVRSAYLRVAVAVASSSIRRPRKAR